MRSISLENEANGGRDNRKKTTILVSTKTDQVLGYESFRQLDDTADDHLDGLLHCLADLESRSDSQTAADIITWRGMMTKVGLRRKVCGRVDMMTDHVGAF